MTLLAIDVPGRKDGGYALLGTDGVVRVGTVKFNTQGREADDYLVLAQTIALAQPQVVIMEHPFLYMIAQNIGAMKMYCALNGIAWWMVGASKAKKVVLNKGNADKKMVKQWAEDLLQMPLSQHQSDSILYLHAYQLLHP
jgi:Holliday junction resolvasome RuvABC endonuclease subunit